MLALLCFCVATEFSVNKDLYIFCGKIKLCIMGRAEEKGARVQVFAIEHDTDALRIRTKGHSSRH